MSNIVFPPTTTVGERMTPSRVRAIKSTVINGIEAIAAGMLPKRLT
ncbi:MAG TPA: hypothetical protein PLL98_00450 [Bacillota bacterium]|nr:hypothetical protein [Bacillota bacterium]HOR84934.1 hypothetical protein [Bacillota bacterium]